MIFKVPFIGFCKKFNLWYLSLFTHKKCYVGRVQLEGQGKRGGGGGSVRALNWKVKYSGGVVGFNCKTYTKKRYLKEKIT
jgi:hypothetical protein